MCHLYYFLFPAWYDWAYINSIPCWGQSKRDWISEKKQHTLRTYSYDNVQICYSMKSNEKCTIKLWWTLQLTRCWTRPIVFCNPGHAAKIRELSCPWWAAIHNQWAVFSLVRQEQCRSGLRTDVMWNSYSLKDLWGMLRRSLKYWI